MNLSLFRRLIGQFLVWSCVSVFAFGLTGCGGGGGGSDDEDDGGPAPMTFNGLVLTLYTGGVQLTFIRSEGDASTGVETGAVTMAPSPGSATVVNSGGTETQLRPSNTISGGRYTYVRSGPEAGTITVTGEGTGVFQGDILLRNANYFRAGTFTRQYEILFGTDGTNLTGIDVNDWGEGDVYPGISWNGSVLRVFGGALVGYGWNLEDSELVNLPKLYPLRLSEEQLVITPNNAAENRFRYEFLTSTFTRFSEAEGDFLEQGVGRSQIIPNPDLTIINYDYQPDATTTNKAIVRIYNATGLPLVYSMTFLDMEKGTYVREDGSTGTFEFPFIEEF